MIVFETILVMLVAAVLLLAVARRWRLPYPVLLALAGAAVALAPLNVSFHLHPELVLALFVAPVLLDAAYDTSLRDLKRHWVAVSSLALIAVGLTTLAVAWVVHGLVPTIPWAAAVTIGAIVAPPDAVAATTVLRDVRMPHRIAVILEGEALLNDASSLLIYRVAVAAILAGGSISAQAIAPVFLLSLVGSIIIGPMLAWAVGWVTTRVDDAPSSIILQFVSTFGVWLIAEQVGLSPVLTMVTYAMTLARSRPAYWPARLRVPSYAVWDTAVLVLNVFAFLLIGLELGPVIATAQPGELGRWTRVGAAVLAAVVIVRLIWSVGAAVWAQRWARRQRAAASGHGPGPNWQTGLIVGWAGTRGIMTVATALALPLDFPERGMLLFAAFTVTLGTLLIQGLTLRPLALALDLPTDATVDREVREARIATVAAALVALSKESGEGGDALRAELEAESRIVSGTEIDQCRPASLDRELRSKALAARRARLHEMRRRDEIGDEAFHRLEQELDIAELALATQS
jgi:CPA1 family monovalent cation:H+ antiporter